MCKQAMQPPSPPPPHPPKDLADFHLRWPEFRSIGAQVAENACMSDMQREVVIWLLRLADRVGPRDLT